MARTGEEGGKGSFEIVGWRGYYGKLRVEYEDLKNELRSTRHAVNFAMTAWHLSEWFWVIELEKSTPLQNVLFSTNFRDGKEFQIYIANKCPDLGLIRAICNGTKHYERNKRDGELMKEAVSIFTPYNSGAYGVGSFVGTLIVETGDGERLNFADVADNVMEFWETVANRLDTERERAPQDVEAATEYKRRPPAQPESRAAHEPQQVEPWLRGPLAGVDTFIVPLLYSLQMAREDLTKYTAGLTTEQIWATPHGFGSVGFHLRHIAGSTDRLMTYVQGGQLSGVQMVELKTEKEPGASREMLLAAVDTAFANAEAIARALDPACLTEPRVVGRKQLPTTVIGLLIHIAEHTQRHVGQAISAAKLAKAGDVRANHSPLTSELS